MLKTILFDLDDTLLDFTRAERAALARALTEMRVPAGDMVLDRYHEINAAQWALLEEGKVTRPQLLIRRFELLFAELGLDRDARETCGRYEGYLAEGCFLIPGAPELLAALAPRYDLYIVSNGAAAVQHSRLDGAGIKPYFKGIFISETIGSDKPSPAFFQAVFAAVPGFSREAALLVGDSLTSDIRGGRSAGIPTCWFDPHGAPRRPDIVPDFRITELQQLPELLRKMDD